MSKKRMVIFTKTNWDEPPRIRHQLARLLSSHGHEVTFFEKSNSRQFSTRKYKDENINFIKHFELIHHQLRPFKFLVKINQILAKYFIQKNVNKNDLDCIINFNYDYSFLKEIFPEKRIITIINDDFVAQAKPWMGSSIHKQLKKTCENSDVVFAVSYPLHASLKKFNESTHLFLPWAGKQYSLSTKEPLKRNTILYWGYIDNRIDWNVIDYLLKHDVKLRFVGSVHPKAQEKVESYMHYDNFELIAPTSIDMLSFDDVVCSILSYDATRNEMKAVTVNNRVFQLLSYGIPLVYSDLPNLIKAPKTVITKCQTNEDYLNAIEYFSTNFNSCQVDIEEFLQDHYSDKRYKLILQHMNESKNVY